MSTGDYISYPERLQMGFMLTKARIDLEFQMHNLNAHAIQGKEAHEWVRVGQRALEDADQELTWFTKRIRASFGLDKISNMPLENIRIPKHDINSPAAKGQPQV